MKFKVIYSCNKLGKTSGRFCALMSLLLAPAFQSCFTGIESTGKIKLTGKDITAMAPSEEDLLLGDIQSSFLDSWSQGKGFIVADEKLRLVIEGGGHTSFTPGERLHFKKALRQTSAFGGEKTILIFEKDGQEIVYPLDKSMEVAGKTVTASDLPMLIDSDLVESVKEKLLNKHLWVKTAVWYDDSLNYTRGRKFIPVVIREVLPGNAFFPLRVKFEDDVSTSGSLLMNIGNSSNESRNFSKLFSFSDPKTKYKNISTEHWSAIQEEKVLPGMTKEECKLAKGNPSEVDSGHNYSNALEIWKFPDGTIIRFVDGLMIN